MVEAELEEVKEPEVKKERADPSSTKIKSNSANKYQHISYKIAERRLEDDSATPYASHCRPDAEIWRRYLNETEIEDRELTQLWNGSLDALLVFAGLFAAILTAFLVESRKDLSEDPQEHLLKEIVQLLKNNTDTTPLPTFHVTPSSLHINGLWFSSLTLTLISALGGVLAKSWLAKYNPPSQREHAVDACERHLRAIRARQWGLEPFIMAIPLLIQVSLFLFFIGLIIQTRGDDNRIWFVIVTLVGIVAIMYMIGTCLPWISPACPFQTPISDFIGLTGIWARYSDDSESHARSWRDLASLPGLVLLTLQDVGQLLSQLRKKPEQIVLQAQILSWVIKNSPKPAMVKEAIKAIAGSKATKELRDELIVAGIRESLFQDLHYSVEVIPGLPKSIEDEPQVESLLYALLRIEQPLNITESHTGDASPLSLLKEGGCLRRWDDFPPFLQTLAFSLRVHMLINSDIDDHKGNWIQTKKNLVRMVDMGAPPHVQYIMLYATIRGLLSDQPILARTCMIVFDRLILLAGIREELYRVNKSTEGTMGGIKEPKLFRTESSCLVKLLMQVSRLCGDNDRETRTAAGNALLKLAEYKSIGNLQQGGVDVFKYTLGDIICMAIPELAIQLQSSIAEVQKNVSALFGKLARTAEFRGVVDTSISQLSESLKDANLNVRRGYISLIHELAKSEDLLGAVSTGVPHVVELAKDEDQLVRDGAASALALLTKHSDLCSKIRPSIPYILGSLKFQPQVVVHVLTKLAERVEFRPIICAGTPQIFELVKSQDHGNVQAFVSLITNFASYAEFRESISAGIPLLIELLADRSRMLQFPISVALNKLTELCGAVGAAIPALFNLLRDDFFRGQSPVTLTLVNLATYSSLRHVILSGLLQFIEDSKDQNLHRDRDIVSIMAKLASYPELQDEIESISTQSINHLNDVDEGIRKRSVSILSQLAGHAELRYTLSSSIPLLICILKDQNSNGHAAAVSVFANLVSHAELRIVFKSLIPQLTDLVGDNEGSTRGYATLALSDFVEYAELHDILLAEARQIVRLLQDQDPNVRSSAASALANLVRDTAFRDVTRTGIQPLIELLKDQHPEVLRSAISTLVKFAEDAEFLEGIGGSIPQLIRLLEDGNLDIRSSSGSVLVKLAQHPGLHVAVTIIPQFIEIIKYPHPGVQSTAVSMLVELAENADLHDPIICAIPQLIRLLQSRYPDIINGIASILMKLANNTKAYDVITTHIKLLMGSLKNPWPPTQSAISEAIFLLVQHANLQAIIGSSMIEVSLASPIVQLGIKGSLEVTQEPSRFASNGSDISQLWHLLNSKDSRALQRGVTALSLEAKFFQSFIQPATNTVIKLLRTETARHLPYLHDLAKHGKLRATVVGATSKLIELLTSDTRIYAYVASITSVITKLADNTDLYSKLRPHIPRLIELLQDEGRNARPAIAYALFKLTDHVSLRRDIGAGIPQLIVVLKDVNSVYRNDVASTLVKLADTVEHRPAFGASIPELTGILKDKYKSNRSLALSILIKLIEDDEFYGTFGASILQILELIKGYDVNSRVAASVVSRLAKNTEFLGIIESYIATLIELLKTEDLGALSALAKLAVHAEFRDAISAGIPHIIGLFRRKDHLSAAEASVLIQLADDEESYRAISAEIIALIEHPEGQSAADLLGAISALGNLANHPRLRGAFGPVIPRLIELLSSHDPVVQSAAVSTLSQLGRYDKFHNAIRPGISSLSTLLKDENPKNRSSAASALANLAQSAELRLLIGASIPQLIDLLKDTDWNVRSCATFALTKLVNGAELSEAFADYIPQLIEALKDTHPHISSNPDPLLVKLAGDENAILRDAIISNIPQIIDLFATRYNRTASNAISVLSKISEHEKTFNAIRNFIPVLVELFQITEFKTSLVATDMTRTLIDQYTRQSFNVQPFVNTMMLLLKDNATAIRATAAKVLKPMIENPDVLYTVVQQGLLASLFELLQDRDPSVIEPATQIFCHLINQGYIRKNILPVILNALNALDDPSDSVQICGATTLLVMFPHERLRNILGEVLPIHASIKYFMPDISSREADMLLTKMEYYGILKEL